MKIKSLTYPQLLRIFQTRSGMIRQNLQSNILFRDGHNGSFVHVSIMDAHAAEYGKCLYEVFVVLREREIIELVYQLYDAYDSTGRVFNRHTKKRFVLEIGAFVDARIETGVFVDVRQVYSLKHYILENSVLI